MSNTDQMGAFISLEEASQMTARYRATIQPGATIAYAISKEFISRILNQQDCEGLRIYMGINEKDETTLVLVGIDSFRNDLSDGLIADNVAPCPSICPLSNSLNT
jgi:hypothetical protein